MGLPPVPPGPVLVVPLAPPLPPVGPVVELPGPVVPSVVVPAVDVDPEIRLPPTGPTLPVHARLDSAAHPDKPNCSAIAAMHPRLLIGTGSLHLPWGFE